MMAPTLLPSTKHCSTILKRRSASASVIEPGSPNSLPCRFRFSRAFSRFSFETAARSDAVVPTRFRGVANSHTLPLLMSYL